MQIGMSPCFAIMFIASTTAAVAQAPEVVTDAPVTHALVATVMGEVGMPLLLLDKGADAHDFQLRPSQVRALNGAALVVWLGPEMTPWLDRAIVSDARANTLSLLHVPGTHLRAFADETDHDEAGHDGAGHDDDHADDAAQDGQSDGHTEAHDHEGTDPHAWLDPDNAALWLGRIADALSQRDPGNALLYRANASLGQTALKALDESLAETLTPAAGKGIVVAHDAYGYFADHYGLTIAASLAEGDAAAPGARHLSEVEAMLGSGQSACIFPEALRDPGPVLTLAEAGGVRVGAALDPAGRLLEPGADLYARLLQGLATGIADCLAAN